MEIEIDIKKRYLYIVVGLILILPAYSYVVSHLAEEIKPGTIYANSTHNITFANGNLTINESLCFGENCSETFPHICNWEGWLCHCNAGGSPTWASEVTTRIRCQNGRITDVEVHKVYVDHDEGDCDSSQSGCDYYSRY